MTIQIYPSIVEIMITRRKQPSKKNSNNNHDRCVVVLLSKSMFPNSTRIPNQRRTWDVVIFLLVLFIYLIVVDCIVVTDAAGNNNNNNYYNSNNKNKNHRYSSSSSSKRPPPPPHILSQREQPSPRPSSNEYKGNNQYWNNNNNNNNNGDMNRSSEFDSGFEYDHQHYPQQQQQQQQQGRSSPPFLPIPSQNTIRNSMDLKNKGSSTLPSIHYSFPQRNAPIDFVSDAHESDTSSMPNATTTQNPRTTTIVPPLTDDSIPKYTSARQDVVTRYIMESYWNRCYVTLSAAMVGCVVISFLGQSLLGQVPSSSILLATSILFSILTWLRNDIYGELIRAISFTIIFSVQRSIQIRNQYPAYQYLYNAILGDTTTNAKRRRRPFPPTNNPWTWSSNQDEDDDIVFQMIPTVVAMAFIGSVMGTNIPLLPSSLGALLGAASFAYTTTLSSSRGDLCRCMGMRIVAFVREFITIANTDLHLPQKSAVVASAVLDKLLILDRQHSIRQRIGSGITAMIDTVSRIQRDMQQQSPQPRAASSNNMDNGRTTGNNSRQRPRYDNVDKVRDNDDDDPQSFYNDESTLDQTQSRLQTNNNDNQRGRNARPERTPAPMPPPETTSNGGGWFSMFSSKKATNKDIGPTNSDVMQNDIDSRDVDGTFPYDDEHDSRWEDPSDVSYH